MSHSAENHSHGSIKEYVLGLILSIVLTAIPFYLAITKVLDVKITMFIIVICAVAQLLVQMILFLHIKADEKNTWNIATALYSLMIVFFVVGGSLWIFMHLNHNMLMGH